MSSVSSSKFQIWKTIKLGAIQNVAGNFRRTLNESGMQTSGYADNILGNPEFTVASEETELDLEIVSTIADFSFNKGTDYSILELAKEFGLELCPAEVGPQLRLQYRDQPDGELLYIGMKPILHQVFCVLNVLSLGSRLWLACDGVCYGMLRRADLHWVFVRPRK